MASHRSPTVRHRRLTQLLRRLREDAGLSREQVTAHMEWNSSRLGKIETGRWKRFAPRELRALLELYAVTDMAQQDEYVQLARDAGKRGWWQPYSDMAGAYIGLEDEAGVIQSFEPQYIPGLLQTEEYARALFRSNPANNVEDVERRVELRMERQKELLDRSNPPELWTVIDEAALKRPVGDGEIMRAQLSHVASIEASHMAIQVLPMSVGAHPGMEGSFVLLDFPNQEDQPVVYLETATDGLYLEEDVMIHRYRLMFNHLRAVALGPAASRTLLRQAAAQL